MARPTIEQSYLAEVKLVNPPVAGQRINFLDIPQLRDKPGQNNKFRVLTVAIECFDVNTLTISPQSNNVVATLAGIMVTFAIGSTEEIFQYPCSDLNPIVNAGLIREFKDKTINLPKSYITITDATGLNVNESVLFNIIYRRGMQKI